MKKTKIFSSLSAVVAAIFFIPAYAMVLVPTVDTKVPTAITANSAIGKGNIANTGGENPIRSIEWGMASGSYTNSCSAETGGIGVYTCNLTNLAPNTKYYLRAKAVNSAGTAYGAQTSFTTAAVAPLLFILAGQSNMMSIGGHIDQIGTENDRIPDNVDFYAMTPGAENNGFIKRANFTSTEYDPEQTLFGPEVGLAKKLTSDYPGRKIIIVKYAIGGTNSCQWKIKNIDTASNSQCLANGTTQTIQETGGTIIAGNFALGNNLLNKLQNQFPSSQNEYKAFIWSQGEADSEKGAVASSGIYNYPAHVKELYETLKTSFSAPEMPMVMSLISRQDGPQDVAGFRATQTAFTQENANVFAVDSKDLPRQDPWHMTGDAILSIGGCYAKALQEGVDVDCKAVITNVNTPVIATKVATDIVATAADGNGIVTNTGGENPTRSIEWGTASGNYTNSCSAETGGIGVYACNLNSLSPNTKYYLRAKAVNSAGTAYGVETFLFTPNKSVVATKVATGITATTAIGSGTVINTGRENPTRSIEWGTASGNYTDSCSAETGGTGVYTCNLTNLVPNTKYYLRAKAVNSAGTAYGVERFLITPSEPVVATKVATNVTATTAIGNGTVTNAGRENPTRSIEWGAASGSYTDFCSAGIGKVGVYSCNLTNLAPNTKYYLRAKAVNSAGTVYGVETFLFTPNKSVVATKVATGITATTAIGSGTVINTGRENPTRSIEWGTASGNYTDSCSAETGGTGVYTCNLTNLVPNTKYYLRAKAVNSAGTVYGVERFFTTIK